MDTWAAASGRRLVHLTRHDCLTLLGTRSIGRVAFCSPTGPVVLPVNYALHEGSPLFRTTSNGSLAERLHDSTLVALEVDDIDEDTRSGWSVLVRGHASVVEHPDLPSTAAGRPEPWAAGPRMLHIRIVATEVTGRRLDPSDDVLAGRSWMRSS